MARANAPVLTSLPAAFEGRLSVYIDQNVVPNFPSADRLAAWTEALLAYHLHHRDPILIVRGQHRGALRREQGVRQVCSDNSPGIWAYLRCHDGAVAPEQLPALLDAGMVPVLMAIGKKEKPAWTYGKALAGSDKTALWGRHLKHCHILAARPQGLALTVRQLALRNVCPANHFLFPSPKAFGMQRLGWTEPSLTTDLGESERVIGWILHRLADHFGTHRTILHRFLDAAGGALPATSPCDGSIRIVRLKSGRPTETTERPASPTNSGPNSSTKNRLMRRWILNARHGHYVATGLPTKGIDVALSFRHLDGTIKPVGTFHLDLPALARVGAARARLAGTQQVFDVRIVRDSDGTLLGRWRRARPRPACVTAGCGFWRRTIAGRN